LVVILSALFASAVAGPWAWFHIASPTPPKWLIFHAKTSIPGFEFHPIEIEEEAREILAAPHLINGAFTARDQRVYAFAGDWIAKDARQMGVVSHTPDICWVGSGMELVNLGQPSSVNIPFAGEALPFECRIFRAPHSADLEMVLWCTLVSGQALEEGFRFAPTEAEQKGDLWQRANANARVRVANQFLRAVTERVPGDGSKQFVRFSSPVHGDWKIALKQLEEFGPRWIDLEVKRASAVETKAEPGLSGN
jgi:hypothetical protein